MQGWFDFELNGSICRVNGAPTNQTLAEYLDELELSEARYSDPSPWMGGAPVIMADFDSQGRPVFRSVDSNLILLPVVAGRQIWTMEGIRELDPSHAVIREIQAHHLESGEASNGSLATLLFEGYYRRDLRTTGQMNDQLDAIASRTANHIAIRRAAKRVFGFSEQQRHDAELKARQMGLDDLATQGRLDLYKDRFSENLVGYEAPEGDLSYVDESKRRFFRPRSVAELLQLKRQHPDAQVISGGTGLSQKASSVEWVGLISTDDVGELHEIRVEDDHWEIGASVSLTTILEVVGKECAVLKKVAARFGSRPVRNRASLGGYLATASGTGQLAPVLMALDARVHLVSSDGERDAPISQFYDGKGKTILRPTEIVRCVVIPRFNKDSLAARGSTSRICDAFVTGRRSAMMEPYLTAAFAVELTKTKEVRKAWISYSGVGKSPIRVRRVEEILNGRKWNETTLFEALPALKRYVVVDDESQYRDQLVITLLQKFFYESGAGDTAKFGAAHRFTDGDQPFFDTMSAG